MCIRDSSSRCPPREASLRRCCLGRLAATISFVDPIFLRRNNNNNNNNNNNEDYYNAINMCVCARARVEGKRSLNRIRNNK